MASYNELLALIDAYINRNGVQAITGQILNGVLKAMVDQLGRGYTLMGYAEPTGDPGTPDGPESWFASVPGTYTNYGEIQVAAGELALLSFAPSEGWTKNTIYEGFREVTATADDNIGFPQVGVTYANGVLSFDFKNIKGEPGENGQDGDPAGFGAVTASVDDQVGTPSVSVSSSGPDTAKNFAFAFHNLKGETGVTSVVATVDNTSGNPQCSVSLQGGQLTLDFTGLKGAQGNTGSSVDYPFTIVNNLTTDDPTQALSAAMGVELDGKVSQLEAKVDDLDEEISIDLTEAQDDDIEVDTNDDGYVAHIDGDGVHSKDFFVQETKTGARKSITDDLSKLDDVEKGTYYGDEEILITDDNNVVKFGVGADGPFTEGRKPLLPFDKRADGTYKEGASTDQPLASIKESMGLLPMFENWGFIGDSLSSGFINVPNVGGVSPLVDTTETIGRNIYPISWGQLICKMCGSKGANYSVGGATTRSWLSYFGGMTPANVGYSDGAKGADFSVKRDVYTIMLATNDAGQGNIPVGDISTDVDLQDYHNNADTYAGNYARIISMIKELVPSAKVFCIVPYKAWSINAESGGYNDVVRQLVTMFDKTYLIDLYTYGGNLDTDYLYLSHSTTQGCIYTAYVIANYIDYIIRKNPQDFIFQGCVSRLANDNGNY